MDLLIECVMAFTVGGAFCVAAQLLIDLTKLTPARILVIYVSTGVFLGAIGLFEPIKELAGCGITVPLIGFGGNIASGVRDAIDSQGPIGILTGPLTAASAGTAAALVFGYLAAVIFNSKPKRL